MSQYILVKHKNGKEFDTQALGMKIVDFYIPPLQVEFDQQNIELGIGEKITGYNVRSRNLKLTLDFYYRNIDEYRRMESLLSEMFLTMNEIVVIDSVQNWKVYKVYALPFASNRGIGTKSRVDIELVLTSGLSESIDIHKKEYTIGYSPIDLTFENTGTFEIDQRNGAEMEMIFTGVASGLTIQNLTTGETWSTSAPITSSDTLVIKDYTAYLNGGNILAQTNKRVITFAVGKNILRVSNAQAGSKLKINTRMYFR